MSIDLKAQSYDDLVKLYREAGDEIQERQSKSPSEYGCCECSFRSTDMDVVYRHHKKVHRYPSEDASTSIERHWK